MKKELEKIGFNKKEVVVYLTLLELGETTISRISQKSKIKRTTVYDVIELLKNKGLVGKTVKNKRNYYFAEDPRLIGEMIKEKERLFSKIIPELLSIANFIDHKPKIRFYEGKGGIHDVYEESLKIKNDTFYGWYAKEFLTGLTKEYYEHYVQKRVKQNIITRGIAPDNPDLISYNKESGSPLREIRFVDQKKFDYKINVSIILFSDRKITIIAHREEIALIIESKYIYTALFSIWKFMWINLENK